MNKEPNETTKAAMQELEIKRLEKENTSLLDLLKETDMFEWAALIGEYKEANAKLEDLFDAQSDDYNKLHEANAKIKKAANKYIDAVDEAFRYHPSEVVKAEFELTETLQIES